MASNRSKFALPKTLPDVKRINFADGPRTLEQWELEHATDAAAIRYTGKPLRELTYTEWNEQVASRSSLKDYLKANRLNSRHELSRLQF